VWHWIEEDGERSSKSDHYLKGKYGLKTLNDDDGDSMSPINNDLLPTTAPNKH